MKVAFKTLGCKVNQYETYAIEEEFRQNGFDIVGFNDDADIYIINTCAVTQTAEKKSRQMIRQVSEKGFTIVTGCAVEEDPLFYFSIKGVDLVVGNTYKHLIYRLSTKMEKGIYFNREWKRPYTYFNFPSYTEKTRAYVKIQDGCNRFCTYCKIPYYRGIERARDPEDIFFEIETLLKKGFKEINLLGINVGSYNFKGYKLYHFLQDIEKLDGEFWVRLSSIEPEDVKELLPLIGECEKWVPHLHIPLQSGDNYILSRMHRNYTREFFRDIITKARGIFPDISITSDIIVGFPGETFLHFRHSYALLEELEIYRFHIFPYSKRKGTAAYYMDDDVPKEEKKRRVNILKDLRNKLMERYHKRFVGKKIKVLIESGKNSYGMSPYYFKVYVDNEKDLVPGRFYMVKVKGLYRDGVRGQLVS